MDSREVIKWIEADGRREVRQKLPQAVQTPNEPGLVTVSSPKKDIPAGTMRSISKQAGITLE
jgi:predicted RNase H-like HicB family nuclease/predicted RNA binding protein YcfA (HicA-like mRNA interferase family)